ncbi:hypothetical protein BDR03DRAFT_950965 [Suillus americanus]|nr:hypothetical protein BDR03DRAFT_950965 [Suillus americanus]
MQENFGMMYAGRFRCWSWKTGKRSPQSPLTLLSKQSSSLCLFHLACYSQRAIRHGFTPRKNDRNGVAAETVDVCFGVERVAQVLV